MTAVLKEDIVGTVNRKPYTYAKKGDKVKVISQRGDILIVNNDKESFSVHVDKVKILNQ